MSLFLSINFHQLEAKQQLEKDKPFNLRKELRIK